MHKDVNLSQDSGTKPVLEPPSALGFWRATAAFGAAAAAFGAVSTADRVAVHSPANRSEGGGTGDEVFLFLFNNKRFSLLGRNTTYIHTRC